MQFAYQNTVVEEPVDGEESIAAEMEEFGNLAPLLAGARARGVADAFEMLGQAAILIDRTGTVLHVGQATVPFFGKHLAVVSRHLVTKTTESNRALQDLIALVISGRKMPAQHSVVIARFGQRPIRVRAIQVPGEADDEMQLLKAVLVVEETKIKPQRSAKSARMRAADLQLDDNEPIHAQSC